MHVELVAFGLVLAVGCAAFLFGMVCLLWRALKFLGRGLTWFLFGPNEGRGLRRPAGPADPRRCPRAGCGHVEHRPAGYCARCGAKMGGADVAPV